MNRFVPTEAQRAQLQLLKDSGAVSEATSVGCGGFGQRHVQVNGVMLSVALAPKGLVGVYKRPAMFGEPKATLYWITMAGLALLHELADFEASYSPAADVAEQLP